MLVVLVRFGRWFEMFLISDGGIRLLEEHSSIHVPFQPPRDQLDLCDMQTNEAETGWTCERREESYSLPTPIRVSFAILTS
jgi:hypothetical protein